MMTTILFVALVKSTIVGLLGMIVCGYFTKPRRPRVLLIDDLRNIEATRVARTYNEGIEALKDGPWDLLLLDHDLGCYDSVGREKTGYDIICFLEENLQYLPERIELVTMNPVGRLKMNAAIVNLYGSHNRRMNK